MPPFWDGGGRQIGSFGARGGLQIGVANKFQPNFDLVAILKEIAILAIFLVYFKTYFWRHLGGFDCGGLEIDCFRGDLQIRTANKFQLNLHFRSQRAMIIQITTRVNQFCEKVKKIYCKKYFHAIPLNCPLLRTDIILSPATNWIYSTAVESIFQQISPRPISKIRF